MPEPALSLDHVAAGYDDRDVLHDVSVAVRAGEMVGVVGPNGAGKSTLLRAAAGLLPARRGRVTLDGEDLATLGARRIARRVAVLPQDAAPTFPTTALETVLLGRIPWRAALSFESDEDVEAAEAALREVDALDLRDRPLGSLSGGERQRVLLARALCQGGSVLLCDEPTNHLDLRHQDEVFALLAAHRDRGAAVVVVTHDLEAAARCCDRLVLVVAGAVHAAGAVEEVLTPEAARAVFGVDLAVRREGGAVHLVRTSAPVRRRAP